MATPPVFSAGAVLTAAQMNAVGLWLITDASFSAQSTINVADVFTADYLNYRVIINVDTASTQTTRNITWKFRTSSGDDSNAIYYYGANLYELGGTTSQVQGAFGATSAVLCNYYGYGDSTAAISIDIMQPQPSGTLTKYIGTASGGNASSQNVGPIACQITTAKSHTGFSFFSSTGTITGSYAVYGYRN